MAGVHGAVAAGHHLASQAGLDVLKAGGNAVDAGIAACGVLSVVKPEACGLGGDFFMLFFDAKTRRVTALNASGPAAALATVERFPNGISSHGPRAVSVPGAVDGWSNAVARFGTRSLGDLLAPAIAYADDGFPVSAYLAKVIRQHRDPLPSFAATFFPNGRPPEAFEVLRQPDLATTLRAIARDGRDAFYEGDVAHRLDAAFRADDGLLRLDDLARYRSEWREPLRVAYRGYDVYELPPVSVGAVVLETANILEGFDLCALDHEGADAIHLEVEAIKLALADRDRYFGDPAFVTIPLAELLSKEHGARARATIDPRSVIPKVGASSFSGGSDTSYIAVVDGEGNAVSCIQSIFHVWGSGWVAPGTGCVMNDRMAGFSLAPGHPNVLAPGKRTISTLNAVLVVRDDRVHWVFGTPGAGAQTPTNVQLLTRVVDHGLNPQLAIESPRWFSEGGAELRVESRIDDATIGELERRGHRITRVAAFDWLLGGAQMIHVNAHGVREAGADPRREGYALAY
jgi:gamma-glutamyltranspeptidase/glutathione hydrolase